MTREEEIAKAAEEAFTTTKYHMPTFEIIGFSLGAHWADTHPKSPWISVNDDLPCNHSDLVLTYKGTPFSTKRILVMTDINTLFL